MGSGMKAWPHGLNGKVEPWREGGGEGGREGGGRGGEGRREGGKEVEGGKEGRTGGKEGGMEVKVGTAYSHNIIALDKPNEFDWFGGLSLLLNLDQW